MIQLPNIQPVATLDKDAIIVSNQALLVDSNHLETLCRRARAAKLEGDWRECVNAFEGLSELRPCSIENLKRPAKAFPGEGNLDQADALLKPAVRWRRGSAGSRFEYAQVLPQRSARGAAMEKPLDIVGLHPLFPEAWRNLGVMLRAECGYAGAEATYKNACGQNTRLVLAWNSLAYLHVKIGHLDDAALCYNQTVSVYTQFTEAHAGPGMLRLLGADSKRGWTKYKWRWQHLGRQRRVLTRPDRTATDLRGRTILRHAVQGTGDPIQVIRYSRFLKKLGAGVGCHCPQCLRELVESMPDLDEVVCGQDPVPKSDVHAPLMSLLSLCGTNLKYNIPVNVPSLVVPRRMKLADALLSTDAILVWLGSAGNPNNRNDRSPSIPPGLLQVLKVIEGIQFFSRQVGGQTLNPFDSRSLIDFGALQSRFADAAAGLVHMELLIAEEKSLAHPAVVLGRPVWMPVPACRDWRWLQNRHYCAWYPVTRNFSAAQPGRLEGITESDQGGLRRVGGIG